MKPRLHVMLIRFSSLGDVVLQTSVIKWLHDTYGPQLKITFVTSREFQDLVSGHPLIQRVITFDRRAGEKVSDLAKKIRTLHAEDPIDVMFDVHATTRSWLLRLMLPTIPRLVVDKRRLERTLLVRLPGKKFWTKWKWLGLEAQVERIPKDMQGIMLAPFKKSEPLTFTPAVERIQHPRKFVVLAPVASFTAKRWPMDHFLTLARTFLAETKDMDLVVVAGPDDKHCEVFNQIQDPRLINLQGKTKLKESMGWMQSAHCVVGNDSGMNHVAEAAGVPVITLFGPTHEGFGFTPHLSQSVALSKDIWCRPCSTTGKRDCFRKEQVCMTTLTPSMVWEKLKERVSA